MAETHLISAQIISGVVRSGLWVPGLALGIPLGVSSVPLVLRNRVHWKYVAFQLCKAKKQMEV